MATGDTALDEQLIAAAWARRKQHEIAPRSADAVRSADGTAYGIVIEYDGSVVTSK